MAKKLEKHLRAPKNISHSTEYLCEATDDNVGKGKYLDIEMVSDSLVNDDREVVYISKCTQSWKVGSTKLWVSRNVSEQRQYSRTLGCTVFFKKTLQIINTLIGEYMIPRSRQPQEDV